jgi:hypothetical protein
MDLHILLALANKSLKDRLEQGMDVAEGPQLIAQAEEALLVGDQNRARECIELSFRATLDDGGLEADIDWGRWLLTTLSTFEDVPPGIMAVLSQTEELYKSGNYVQATFLIDKLRRTAERRLLKHSRKLYKYTKRLYKGSKKDLDPASRKQVKELLSKANSWMGSGVLYSRKKALHLIHEIHEIVQPTTPSNR